MGMIYIVNNFDYISIRLYGFWHKQSDLYDWISLQVNNSYLSEKQNYAAVALHYFFQQYL